MNETLLNFYKGIGVDGKGRSFQDMIDLSDIQLERTHDVVQWLYPLKEASAYNKKAPLLDDETILAMQSSEYKTNLELAANRFMSFLCDASWISPKNHNYLRITRIIKFYKLVNREDLAMQFATLATACAEEFPDKIEPTTIKFWNDAING